MAKIVLSDIEGGYNLSKINDNFSKIEDAFNNDVLYRSGTNEDNAIEQDIDVNGKYLYNLPTPTSPSHAVSKQWVEDTFLQAPINAAASAAAALISAQNADVSEANAAASAVEAAASAVNSEASAVSSADSAAQASIYSSMGLGGAVAFDFGLVTDLIIIFPTDWGTVV